MVNVVNELLKQMVAYTPIYTLSSLGLVIGGRAGIFNVSGEGTMLAAASAGYIVALQTGNWLLGILASAAMGAAFGFTLVFIHETTKVSQFIIGISLVILGAGLSDLLYKLVLGVQLFIPEAPKVPEVRIPLLSRIPFLSAFINQNVIVYLTYALVILVYYFLYKTKPGLELRAVGENPKAADVVGINVTLTRYLTTTLGGALLGIAGGYLPLVVTGTYTPNITNGRGFIAVGIAIFASWRPERTFLGALLFAAIEAIALQMQLSGTVIPYQFFLMTPFIGILVVMWLFKKKVEFPASLGKPYSRE
ncbi:MAG TPA: ABC transporter permease [Thermotogae bacterium]|nr:ABC transporter permease [Thermotogota bacterium]